MIKDEQVEKALEYFRDNASEYGRLVGQCKALEHRRKIVHAQKYMTVSGKLAERDAQATTCPEYIKIIEDIENAETEKATIATHLERARLTIDVWRTENANQRKGNI